MLGKVLAVTFVGAVELVIGPICDVVIVGTDSICGVVTVAGDVMRVGVV